MREKEEMPAELKAFEAKLATLVPEDKRLDQARLLYAAGLASAQTGANVAARIWAAAFGTMSVVAVSLFVVLLLRPEPKVKIVERIVRVPVQIERHVATKEIPKSKSPLGNINTQAMVSTSVHSTLANAQKNVIANKDKQASKRPVLPQRPLRLKTEPTSICISVMANNTTEDMEKNPRQNGRDLINTPQPSENKTYGELLEELTKQQD